MKTIETTLKEEKQRLEKIVEKAKERLKTAPKGHLRIRQWHGIVEYYYNETGASDGNMRRDNIDRDKNCGAPDVDRDKNCGAPDVDRDKNCGAPDIDRDKNCGAPDIDRDKNYGDAGINRNKNRGNTNGRYTKKSERNLAKGIAQRDYDANVVKNAEARVRAIDIFLDKYEKTSLKILYQKINPHRRELIDAPIISDDEFIKRWQEVEYVGKSFEEDYQEIITEKGERVRSKSEKIIADKLFLLGIPYRYEYPLVLTGNIKVYPDFTILRMPEREEVYLEHFGMMDDSNYVENVIYKLNSYEKNGIYLGVNLFITYETKKMPLNTRVLDRFLKKLFCEE